MKNGRRATGQWMGPLHISAVISKLVKKFHNDLIQNKSENGTKCNMEAFCNKEQQVWYLNSTIVQSGLEKAHFTSNTCFQGKQVKRMCFRGLLNFFSLLPKPLYSYVLLALL